MHKYPASHVDVGEDKPAVSQYIPGVHTVQSSIVINPVELPNEPGGHSPPLAPVPISQY